MTKDPICGMMVDKATALHAERDGETFYFCSEHCRQKFIGQARPAKVIPLTSADTGTGCCGGAKAKPAITFSRCPDSRLAPALPKLLVGAVNHWLQLLAPLPSS